MLGIAPMTPFLVLFFGIAAVFCLVGLLSLAANVIRSWRAELQNEREAKRFMQASRGYIPESKLVD